MKPAPNLCASPLTTVPTSLRPPLPEWNSTSITSENWGVAETPYEDADLPALPIDIQVKTKAWMRPQEFVTKAVNAHQEAKKIVDSHALAQLIKTEVPSGVAEGIESASQATPSTAEQPISYEIQLLLPFEGDLKPTVEGVPPPEEVKEVKEPPKKGNDKKGGKDNKEAPAAEAPKPVKIILPRKVLRRFLYPRDTGLSLPPNPLEENNPEITFTKFLHNFSSVVTLISSLPELIPPEAFLWESIYPKGPDGRPAVSPSGKYLVRVFYEGKWRRIFVDDRMPVDDEGNVLLVKTECPNEIWPYILAKAILKLFNSSNLSAMDMFVALTGLVEEPVSQTSDILATVILSVPHAVVDIPRKKKQSKGNDKKRKKKKHHKIPKRSHEASEVTSATEVKTAEGIVVDEKDKINLDNNKHSFPVINSVSSGC